MRKNIAKRALAVVLTLALTVGSAGAVFAVEHKANGTNIATTTWSSFSVRDEKHGAPVTEWWQNLQKTMADDEAEARKTLTGKPLQDRLTEIAGYESFTHAYITAGTNSASGVDLYVENTGWDGEYNPFNGELVADNPWGIKLFTGRMEVEKSRTYTISFHITSTLKATNTVKDDKGNAKLDASGRPIQETITVKHVGIKAYDPVAKGEPAVDFDSISGAGATSGGILALDSNNQAGYDVTATVTVPSTHESDYLSVMFSAGAYLLSYPGEVAMSGNITISNFKVVAGNQYTVKFLDGAKTVATKYVSPNGKVSVTDPVKKGYTFAGWYVNGRKFNLASGINSDLTLTAKWTKVKAPKKVKIKKVKSTKSKRLTVTLQKVKGVQGYQIQYANNKKFKKKKTKTTTKASYTIKKLKSGVKYYVRVKAYKTDSVGKKYYSKKWSKAKGAYVR